MRIWNRWLLGGALALWAAGAQAQGTPVLRHTFENSDGGWMAMGTNAKAAVTNEAAHVKEGKAALKFDYQIAKGEMNVLVLPVQEGALAKAKSLKFWAKADHTTPVVIALAEKDGGRYMTVFYAPQDKWQPVELSISDFTLTEGKDDPKDPNNKLDLDKIETISIMDLGLLFAQADDPNLAALFSVQTGAHTLYLDDFTVGEETLPSGFSSINGDVRLDTFAHPQLAWLGIGGVILSSSTGKPLEGKGLQAEYRQAPRKVMGLIRSIGKGKLAGMERLTFDVASAKPVKMIVQVEEVSGGKYNKVIEIPGGSEVQHIRLTFAEFTAADDSKDDNNRLDIDQVHQVLFIDAGGLLDPNQAEQDNTLWIGSVRAK